MPRPLRVENLSGKAAFCGPTALSALTGKDVSEFTTNKHGGMSFADIGLGLGLASGARCDWLKKRVPLHRALPLKSRGIVFVGRIKNGHYLAFDGKVVLDTMSGARGRWVYDHPCRNKRVLFVWTLKDDVDVETRAE